MCVCECVRESVCMSPPRVSYGEKRKRKRECVISVGIGFQQHYYD